MKKGTYLIPLLMLGLKSQTVLAADTVSIAERDLLIVSNLETHGKKEYAWLYRFLDVMSVSLAEQKLKDSYRHIHVLAGEKALAANFTQTLESLTQDPGLAALDVFIHLHGAPDRLWFHDRMMATESLGSEIKSSVSQPSKLRSLYSTACYGKSHADDFLNAGFAVVNGAEKVNTNSPHDYPAFMNAWKSGAEFEAAQEEGNHPGWIAFYDSLAQAAGFTDVGSYKVVEGQGHITINIRTDQERLNRIATIPNVPGELKDTAESRRDQEKARMEALTALMDELRANPETRPHLETVLNYLQSASSEMFSVRNLPSDRNGLAVLDGNSSLVMIKDGRIRAHWLALMDIVGRQTSE